MWAHSRLLRDVLALGVVTAAAGVLCATFNISELLRRLTAPWERLQLDELPAVLVVFSLGLAWFAARRYREAQQEILRRKAAEARLESALADNRRLSQTYIALQEGERKSLARELHDELGQYLNVIKLDAVSMRDGRAEEPASGDPARAIVENCDHIHAALTGLLRRLRPVGLDELGLAAALEHCVEAWRARLPHVQLRLVLSGNFGDMSEGAALSAYRLVQEALTNIAKHAGPARATVQLERSVSAAASGEGIRVIVADDGVGFDLSAQTRGLGLIGMRERLSALGGTLELTSSPGCGCRLEAWIPVANSALPGGSCPP